jgi:hypothetical protein
LSLSQAPSSKREFLSSASVSIVYLTQCPLGAGASVVVAGFIPNLS